MIADAQIKSKVSPWEHQPHGYHLICNQPATLLAWEMGCGKSKIVVDAVCNLDDCTRVLILCPKSVIDIWPEEFAKHGACPVNVVPLRIGAIRQRAKEAQTKMALADIRGEKIALVINYEAAWQGDFAKLAQSTKWDMVVADECHRIKSPRGKISWFMKRLGPKAKRRVGLTGTPLPHSPLDAYGQYRFLDPTIFGTSYVRFRARYAVMGGYQNHQVLSFQNQDELHEKFYSIAHRVKKADVLDLPEVIHERRVIHLSSQARRLYDELKAEFITDVGSGVITASNALSRLLRLQQITSGFGVIETGAKVEVDQGKYNALLDIFTDLDKSEPVVVFCRFTRDIDQVIKAAEKMDRKCYELSGQFNELAEWKERKNIHKCDTCRNQDVYEGPGPSVGCNMAPPGDPGHCPGTMYPAQIGDVLAVQIQAGGVGIDLTRAAYAIYFSLGFSLADYLQSLARLHRPGQTRSVTYLHLVAKNTVDEKVYTALSKRRQVVEEILKQVRKNPRVMTHDEMVMHDFKALFM